MLLIRYDRKITDIDGSFSMIIVFTASIPLNHHIIITIVLIIIIIILFTVSISEAETEQEQLLAQGFPPHQH